MKCILYSTSSNTEDFRTRLVEDSWRKFRLKPTGIACVVFQVPTPPNNNFSCYQIISHRAIPPSIKSYRTNAVSRLISDGCTAKEKNPVLLLKTLLWQSFLYAMVSPLPCLFLLCDGFWKSGNILNCSGQRGLAFSHVGSNLDF